MKFIDINEVCISRFEVGKAFIRRAAARFSTFQLHCSRMIPAHLVLETGEHQMMKCWVSDHFKLQPQGFPGCQSRLVTTGPDWSIPAHLRSQLRLPRPGSQQDWWRFPRSSVSLILITGLGWTTGRHEWSVETNQGASWYDLFHGRKLFRADQERDRENWENLIIF